MSEKDPVCGMDVEPATAAGKAEHGGTTYYFCSKHCLHSFKQGPERYVRATGAPAVCCHGDGKHLHGHVHAPATGPVAPALAGATYTCPMHPEVVQVGSGSCPKCGMALVPIAGTG